MIGFIKWYRYYIPPDAYKDVIILILVLYILFG